MVMSDYPAECAVLGSVLLDPRALTHLNFLHGSDFFSPSHDTIFGLMIRLSLTGKVPDTILLGNELEKLGKLKEIGGWSYLTTLEDAVPTPGNAEHYGRIVKDFSVRRKLLYTGGDIMEMAQNNDRTTSESVDEAHRMVYALSEAAETDFIEAPALFEEVFTEIEAASKNPNALQGVPSGFHDLDDITMGFREDDLIIVAGRPSIGKTTFVLNIAQYNAVKRGMSVLIFSLEMGAKLIGQKMMSAHTGIDSKMLRRGKLTDKQWEQVSESLGPLTESGVIVEESSYLTETMLLTKSRDRKMSRNVGLIVVDFLQLMQGRGENEQAQVGSIAQTLKRVAKELHVPVLAACQLNRAPEGRREDHRPTLSDMRSSGQIEQVADTVLGLYNEGYYDRTLPRNKAEVIFLKHRNGQVGDVVNLGFDGAANRFTNLTRRQYTA